MKFKSNLSSSLSLIVMFILLCISLLTLIIKASPNIINGNTYNVTFSTDYPSALSNADGSRSIQPDGMNGSIQVNDSRQIPAKPDRGEACLALREFTTSHFALNCEI
ncbi:MAG: hypothetical protein HQK77_16855 [Desulfobacterales bacterium]|nr:hypothetical protein [Desulfobacterales bacterium]